MQSCLILMPTLVYFLFLLAKVLAKILLIFFAYQRLVIEKNFIAYFTLLAVIWSCGFIWGEGEAKRHSGLTLQLRQIENLLR